MGEKTKKIVVISLGGSIVVPEPNKVDVEFLRKFKDLIISFVKENYKFVIIVGGGKINRHYNEVARNINKRVKNIDLDWLGIAVTKLNAELIRVIFDDLAFSKVVSNPEEKVKTKHPIIVGSGYKPGHSTDLDAVVRARTVGAQLVVNLSNIDYVYTDDPKKNPQAKPIEKISWSDFLKMLDKITGSRWKPRMNAPFDPVAARLAQKYGLTVIVANGRNIANLAKILAGKKFVGTIIK
jgi:uridylate kinase